MNAEELADILERLIGNPQDREQILRQANLNASDRNELEELAEAADALWGAAQAAPALKDDPAAAMLGLVPDPECVLDAKRLTRARKRAGLKTSDLVTKLRQSGWNYTPGDVFRWESRSAIEVPPAVVQAIARILGTSVHELIAERTEDTQPSYLSNARTDARFAELVARWAEVTEVSTVVAAASLESRMLATVHRGSTPDSEQLLLSLEELVSSIERSRRDRRFE